MIRLWETRRRLRAVSGAAAGMEVQYVAVYTSDRRGSLGWIWSLVEGEDLLGVVFGALWFYLSFRG